MPVIFDKAEITLWPTKIRLPLNGSGAELLRAAAEDRVCFWPASRRIDKAGGGDDAATLVNEVRV
jgi:hypothetical protein